MRAVLRPAALCLLLAGPSGAQQQPRRFVDMEAAECPAEAFAAGAARVTADCCATTTTHSNVAGGGHRRLQQKGPSCAIPATCPSANCAATFDAFWDSCSLSLGRTGVDLAPYKALHASCAAMAQPCEPVYLGPDVGMQHVFVYTEPDGCELSLERVFAVCTDPRTLATCLSYVASPEPEPEPEPALPECQQVFLGPQVGFVDVMERGLSITMLSVVCSGVSPLLPAATPQLSAYELTSCGGVGAADVPDVRGLSPQQ
eukprot:COSAG04_NODE_312_length_17133_cov_31.976928_20_plen_258_part_00